MRKLSVIGIGAGNPDYLTLQAAKALQTLDVVFLIDKGDEKSALAKLRKDICTEHIHKPYRIVEAKDPERDRAPADYGKAVSDWHEKRATIYAAMIRDELKDDQHGAFLVWGDPCLYDSTLRILERVAATKTVEFEIDVIPGITAVQALAAQHRIPINRIGEPVALTTGRRYAAGERSADDALVMLDGECAFNTAPADMEIFWGAYLGTPDEILISGRVGEKRAEIERVRTEARERHGWIMDTYLLRRRVT
jgi:precorrin-6A synthase